MGPPKDEVDKFYDEVSKHYPGTPVVLPDGLTITAYPVGLKSIRQFSKQIKRALSSVAGLNVERDSNTGQITPKSAQIVIPILLDIIQEDLMDLVVQTCKPDISNLPHWNVPPVLEAWLIENFGEEGKIRPWVQAIESVLGRLTGESIPIWETVSKLLSPAAMKGMISSMFNKKASPTAAGQSPSSGSGSPSPSVEPTASVPIES